MLLRNDHHGKLTWVLGLKYTHFGYRSHQGNGSEKKIEF